MFWNKVIKIINFQTINDFTLLSLFSKISIRNKDFYVLKYIICVIFLLAVPQDYFCQNLNIEHNQKNAKIHLSFWAPTIRK